MKKTISAIVAVLIACGIGTFYIPSRASLEFYEVRDLVYTLDFHGIDISLVTDPPIPAAFEPESWVGPEMASFLESVIPGPWDESEGNVVEFRNCLLIVRAGPVQQKAVQAFLWTIRAKNDALKVLGRGAARAKVFLLKLSRWTPWRVPEDRSGP